MVGLTIPVGEFVVTGQTVFTMIDTSAWEAVAYFRETELPAIQIGDKAEVYVMAAPDQPVMGTVVSTGWGVRSEDAATVLGLPIVSSSLNWVKVAKRFPVYIHLEDPPEALMRVGASAEVAIAGASEEAADGGDR